MSEPEEVPTPPAEHAGIVYQQQPTVCTCCHTCLAMLMGCDVQEIMSRIQSAGMGDDEILVVMKRAGIQYLRVAHGSALWQGWQLVIAPSLNVGIGSLHAVLVHFDESTYETVVFDPSTRKRYHPAGRDLRGYRSLALVRPSGDIARFDRKWLLFTPPPAAAADPSTH